jgi:beta-1,4-N-acetylglucosaminyltransferase
MMNIVTSLQKDRFTPRYYVAALTDNMSLQKAQVYEQSLIQVEVNYYVPWNQRLCWELARLFKIWNMIIFSAFQSDGMKTAENAHFMQIYRSREVGQSYITSIATTLLATLHAMWLVIRIRPQVVCT